jgi:hypothetical protein
MLSRFLVALNRLAIRFVKGMFSYQIFLVLEPLPSLELLLQRAVRHASVRAAPFDEASSGEAPASIGRG